MLHGRSAFTGKRRMCGGYSMSYYYTTVSWQDTGELTFALILVNNDDFVSRYRLLRKGREKTLNELGTRNSRLGFWYTLRYVFLQQ